jgi:hypothetical protein
MGKKCSTENNQLSKAKESPVSCSQTLYTASENRRMSAHDNPDAREHYLTEFTSEFWL